MSFVQVTQRAKGKENVQENAKLLFVMASLLNNEWFRLSKRVEDNADLFSCYCQQFSVNSRFEWFEVKTLKWRAAPSIFIFIFFKEEKKIVWKRKTGWTEQVCIRNTWSVHLPTRNWMQLLSQSTDTARDKTRNKQRRFDPIRSPIVDCSRKPNLLESLKTKKEAVKKSDNPLSGFYSLFFLSSNKRCATRHTPNNWMNYEGRIPLLFLLSFRLKQYQWNPNGIEEEKRRVFWDTSYS